MLTSPERLPSGLRSALASHANTLLLSVASAWEIAIKYRLGKLALPEPPRKFIAARLVRDGIAALPVELHHATHVASLPEHHRDPFDRLLVAQATLEGLTLATVDEAFDPYSVRRLRR